MTTLIAEDLLLLLLDDDKGTTTSSYIDTVLGGAVLMDLALGGAVTVEPKTRVWRSATVRPEPGATPEDPLLRAALATVAEKERPAQSLVGRLGKGIKGELADRLVARGILDRQDDRVLGLFPRTRWPAVDSSHEEEVRRALSAVLIEGREPDERTGALVALLKSIDRAHKTVPREGLSAGEVRERAKRISEGAWAAKAVKDAIAASTAAIAAGTAAAAAGATASGS